MTNAEMRRSSTSFPWSIAAFGGPAQGRVPGSTFCPTLPLSLSESVASEQPPPHFAPPRLIAKLLNAGRTFKIVHGTDPITKKDYFMAHVADQRPEWVDYQASKHSLRSTSPTASRINICLASLQQLPSVSSTAVSES